MAQATTRRNVESAGFEPEDAEVARAVTRSTARKTSGNAHHGRHRSGKKRITAFRAVALQHPAAGAAARAQWRGRAARGRRLAKRSTNGVTGALSDVGITVGFDGRKGRPVRGSTVGKVGAVRRIGGLQGEGPGARIGTAAAAAWPRGLALRSRLVLAAQVARMPAGGLNQLKSVVRAASRSARRSARPVSASESATSAWRSSGRNSRSDDFPLEVLIKAPVTFAPRLSGGASPTAAGADDRIAAYAASRSGPATSLASRRSF